MKDSNHVVIQGWMLNHLGIKGNELILFAVIYGFSQNGTARYKGSLSYISNSLKISERSVVKLAKKLCERSYIVKTLKPSGNEYHYNAELIDPILKGYEESAGGMKKVQGSHEESAGESHEESSYNNYTTNNSTKNNNINFDNILKFLNQKTGKAMRVISDVVKKKYRARLKEGYTKEDIKNAIINAVKAPHHIENGFQYLTIEFFSRSATLDKYAYISSTQKPKQKRSSSKVSTDEIPVG